MSSAPLTTDGGDDPGDTWEAIGRALLASALADGRGDVDDAVDALERACRRDEPLDAEDVRHARNAIHRLQCVLEDDLAPVVDGVESWEQPPETNYGVLREWAGCDESEDGDE